MKKYILLAFVAFVASGCSSTITKNFKVFTDPPDSNIRVVSGMDMREQKFRSPATITVDVPKDPALLAKASLEVQKDNYKPRTIPLRDIKDGDTLNIKLERVLRDIVRYRLTYRLTSPVVSQELQFKDRTVAVAFSIGEQSFKMRFENHSAYDVKILWERAEYTDVNGQSHRLMHSGVRYQDRNNPIADQYVLSHGSVEEAVIPIDNVYMSAQKKNYDIRPLFPIESDVAAGLKGKSIILFIPVEVDRQIVPYNFKIEITNSVKEVVKG